MELVPVLDLMNGLVVRGRGGQRELYESLPSELTHSFDPVENCLAFLRAFNVRQVYVADLDAIRFGGDCHPVIHKLAHCGVEIAVDAGTTTPEAVGKLFAAGVSKVIVGLESLRSLDELDVILRAFDPERILFSLDLHDGRPLGAAGRGLNPVQIAVQAADLGLRSLIVLEFSHIGLSGGVPTGDLCHAIKRRRPDLVVWTGGGVSSVIDLHKLRLAHVDAVMIATALHDGIITPAEWQAFEAADSNRILEATDG